MSKEFSGQLKSVAQPAPADLLLTNNNLETVEENVEIDTALMLQKAFRIIDTFEELDLTSKNIVLERLKEITRLEQTSLTEDELTVEQAAAFLGVSDRTIRNYLKSGKLQGVKKGKRWLFSKSNLEKLLGK